MKEVKQVIILRKDLRNTDGHKINKGKYSAQSAHGSNANIIKLLRNGQDYENDLFHKKNEDFTLHLEVKVGTPLHTWLTGSFVKPVLACNSENELSHPVPELLSLIECTL